MRLIRSAITLSIFGLAFAGCGGGGSTPTPAPAPTATAAPAPTPTPAPLKASYVFAGDPSGKTTVEYGLTGTVPIATLSATGAPNAFAFDASGNVYVAFAGATVEEHAAGTHRLVRTITGFHHVNDIALDAKGVLYVVDGDDTTTPPTGPSNLSKVLPGATSPSAVLLSFPVVLGTYPSLITLSTVAIDAAGNVYAGADKIYAFAPGATAPTRTISIGGQAPTALAFDRSGNLYAYASEVDGAEDASNIYKIAAGGATSVIIDPGVGPAETPQSLAFDSAGNLYELNDPYVNYQDQLSVGNVLQGFLTGSAPLVRTANFPVALAADPLKNLYVLDADSVTNSVPGVGEHISQYAYSSVTPTRTFESSGTAIGLSSVP